MTHDPTDPNGVPPVNPPRVEPRVAVDPGARPEPVTVQPQHDLEGPPARRSWFGGRKQKPPPPPAKPVRKRPSRSERSRSPFIAGANAALTILVLVLVGLAATVQYGIKKFDEPGPLLADTSITVPKGAGSRDIAETLERGGVIDGKWVFVMGVRATGNNDKLQAGEYAIPARASMRTIMDMLSSGKVVEHTVTLPEGLTSMQIVNRLMEEPILSGSVREVPPEGSLLPETYRVTRGASREQLLQRMAAAQKNLLDEVWEKRSPNVPVKSARELVTLASIVEKETGIPSERPRVAAVFSNRLAKRMRLQSDPTIIYGLVSGKGTLGRPILRSEITRPTPYNTYTIPALPPGPIANPGRASLEATANPAPTKDLYFVADGSGGHAFAETYAQHQQNVSRWRTLDKPDTDRAPIEAVPAEAAADPAEAPVAPEAQPPRKPAPNGAAAPKPRAPAAAGTAQPRPPAPGTAPPPRRTTPPPPAQ